MHQKQPDEQRQRSQHPSKAVRERSAQSRFPEHHGGAPAEHGSAGLQSGGARSLHGGQKAHGEEQPRGMAQDQVATCRERENLDGAAFAGQGVVGRDGDEFHQVDDSGESHGEEYE